jgi:hypothetical protein
MASLVSSETRVKGPCVVGEGVMSSMAEGSSMRAVGGGGVGDHAEGVEGAGGRGAVGVTVASMAAQRLVRKCLRRGHDSSVAMWSLPESFFSKQRKQVGGQSQCVPLCLAPWTLQWYL